MSQYSPAARDFQTFCGASRERHELEGYSKVPVQHHQSELAFQLASVTICAK